MQITTARDAPLGAWHLNPKGTKVRVVSYDEASKHYLVETERGVKTPVPPTYPLTIIEPDAAAGKVGIEELVGRPRDQVEPHLAALRENELENLAARDTRMWVADAVMRELDRRAKGSSVAPAPAVSAPAAPPLISPCLVCGVGYPSPPGLHHSNVQCKANLAAKSMPLVEAAITTCALTLPPLPTAPLIAELEAIEERIPEAGGRSSAFMAGRAAHFNGKPIDGDVPIVDDLSYEQTVAEFERGWREAEQLAKDEPGFVKQLAAPMAAEVDALATDDEQSDRDPAFDGMPESVARGFESSPTTITDQNPVDDTPAPVVSAPAARGYCPHCGREGERLKNGTIRVHQPIGARPGAERCDGSGKPALDTPAVKPTPAPYTPAELAAIRLEALTKARALRDGHDADRIAELMALPEQTVCNMLESALNLVEAGSGSVLVVQELCDEALEAREVLRPHLRPVLNLLERLPLRQQEWNTVEDHLRAALTALTPRVAQKSQTTEPTEPANVLSESSEVALQSSAANAEPERAPVAAESAAATPSAAPPTTAPEPAPEAPETIRLLVGTVRESAAALAGCYEVEVLRLALAWEEQHQARRTVMERIEERLARIEAGTAKPRREEEARIQLPPRPAMDVLEAMRLLVSIVEGAATKGVRIEIKITPDPTLAP